MSAIGDFVAYKNMDNLELCNRFVSSIGGCMMGLTTRCSQLADRELA
jgi:hypothetical protein